ncbi:hypothetical protein B0H17DRAFT_1138335 [Mycena rosella]|uniref:Uncharacterized protein n=1 Tax=Mycena rosella TaxID=1033263 RepID=A0AAD7G9Y9_MYCRO|nr:hypothetical protein B0H17DRAFT_1138335 [Mycena rosella]
MSLMTCKLQGSHNEVIRLDVHSIVLLAPSGCASKIAQESNFSRNDGGDAVPGLMCTSSGRKKIGSSEQITNASKNTEEHSQFVSESHSLKGVVEIVLVRIMVRQRSATASATVPEQLATLQIPPGAPRTYALSASTPRYFTSSERNSYRDGSDLVKATTVQALTRRRRLARCWRRVRDAVYAYGSPHSASIRGAMDPAPRADARKRLIPAPGATYPFWQPRTPPALHLERPLYPPEFALGLCTAASTTIDLAPIFAARKRQLKGFQFIKHSPFWKNQHQHAILTPRPRLNTLTLGFVSRLIETSYACSIAIVFLPFPSPFSPPAPADAVPPPALSAIADALTRLFCSSPRTAGALVIDAAQELVTRASAASSACDSFPTAEDEEWKDLLPRAVRLSFEFGSPRLSDFVSQLLDFLYGCNYPHGLRRREARLNLPVLTLTPPATGPSFSKLRDAFRTPRPRFRPECYASGMTAAGTTCMASDSGIFICAESFLLHPLGVREPRAGQRARQHVVRRPEREADDVFTDGFVLGLTVHTTLDLVGYKSKLSKILLPRRHFFRGYRPGSSTSRSGAQGYLVHYGLGGLEAPLLALILAVLESSSPADVRLRRRFWIPSLFAYITAAGFVSIAYYRDIPNPHRNAVTHRIPLLAVVEPTPPQSYEPPVTPRPNPDSTAPSEDNAAAASAAIIPARGGRFGHRRDDERAPARILRRTVTSHYKPPPASACGFPDDGRAVHSLLRDGDILGVSKCYICADSTHDWVVAAAFLGPMPRPHIDAPHCTNLDVQDDQASQTRCEWPSIWRTRLRDLKCRGARGQALKHDGDICGALHGGSVQKRSEKPFFKKKVQHGGAAEEGRKGAKGASQIPPKNRGTSA